MAKNIIDLDPIGPITFTGEVEIPSLDEVKIVDFTFKFRDRVELAQLIDDYIAQSKPAPVALGESTADAEPKEPAPIDNVAQALELVESDVRAIKDVATGWGLAAEFSDENLRKLCRMYAGAATAVLIRYRALIVQGRPGN